MTKTARSPLRDKPLRLPGQSVQERLFEVLYDRMMAPVLMAFFLTAMMAMDWIRYFTGAPPTPRLLSAIAIIAIGYAVIRVRSLWPELQQLKLGRQGERVVAEFLEPLRANGYQVFTISAGTGST